MGFTGDNDIINEITLNSIMDGRSKDIKRHSKKKRHEKYERYVKYDKCDQKYDQKYDYQKYDHQKYDKYDKYDISDLDELALQYEAQKLLNEIRAEIRYAETCIDFGEYCSQFACWNWHDGVQETIYEYDECVLNGDETG